MFKLALAIKHLFLPIAPIRILVSNIFVKRLDLEEHSCRLILLLAIYESTYKKTTLVSVTKRL